MRFLLRVADWIDALSEYAGKLSALLVFLVVVVGFYNVAARYVGRFVGTRLTSNVWIELQWYIYSLLFFFGFPYILKHNVNVRIDIFYVNWPPRARAIVDLIGNLFFLIPFCLVGLYATFNPVMSSWGRLPDGSFGTWEVSPDPDGLPRAPIKSMILVAFFLLLLQGIAQTIKAIAILVGYPTPE